MPSQITVAFKTSVTSEEISINGFTMAPGELAKAKEAISFAGGMREFDALPPYISFEAFSIHFNEDGTLILTHASRPTKSLKFSFDTIDSLISALDAALAQSVDLKRLRPSPRPTGGFVTKTPDLI